MSSRYLDLARQAPRSSEAGGFRPCLDCGQGADELTLFCPPCWDRRRERGRLLAFDPDRRRRAEARLLGRVCSACGGSSWTLNDRGDSWCATCFPPRGDRP